MPILRWAQGFFKSFDSCFFGLDSFEKINTIGTVFDTFFKKCPYQGIAVERE